MTQRAGFAAAERTSGLLRGKVTELNRCADRYLVW